MNFAKIFAMILGLVKPAVLTAEAIHGQAVAGASKLAMVQTGVAGAVMASDGFLGVDNAHLAAQIGNLTNAAIQIVVDQTKKSGEYDAARKASLNLPVLTEGSTAAK